jgi:hypothetical protein
MSERDAPASPKFRRRWCVALPRDTVLLPSSDLYFRLFLSREVVILAIEFKT